MSGIFRISDVTKWKAEKLFPKVLELERVIWIQRMGAKNQPNKQHNKWPDAGRPTVKEMYWQKKLSSSQYSREISRKRSWFPRSLSAGDHMLQNHSSARFRNEKLKETSSLFRLDPFLDRQKGFLRVGGRRGGGERLKKAAIAFEVNHPIIITQNESHQRAYYQTLPERRSAPPGP